jgi:hypothetical protein
MQDGIVVNVIEWDGSDSYETGHTLIAAATVAPAWIGWSLIDGQWIPPKETR